MSRYRTALGEEFLIERRLPRIGWRPRWHGTSDTSLLDLSDIGDDDTGILAVIGLVLLVLGLAILLVPLLLFVGEVALVVALVVPVMVVALAVGLKQHTVVLRTGHGGKVLEERPARGIVGTLRVSRELRAACDAGAFRGAVLEQSRAAQ